MQIDLDVIWWLAVIVIGVFLVVSTLYDAGVIFN